VRRVETSIFLEPMVTDIDSWFAELDRFAEVSFVEDGRRQPPMPEAEDLFAYPFCSIPMPRSRCSTMSLPEFARVPGLQWQDWTAQA
jgi:hypothetical protein